MGIPEMKAAVLKRLEDADEKLIRMFYVIMEAYQVEEHDPVVSYDAHGNPRKVSELAAILEAGVAAAKRGEGIDIDELDRKSKEWVKVTK